MKVVAAPKLKRDYVGKQVRLISELKNYWGSAPKNTLAIITNQGRNGSTIMCDPCPCCGNQLILDRLGAEKFEFVQQP